MIDSNWYLVSAIKYAVQVTGMEFGTYSGHSFRIRVGIVRASSEDIVWWKSLAYQKYVTILTNNMLTTPYCVEFLNCIFIMDAFHVYTGMLRLVLLVP